jgi:methyl-accepting chemotaxis protein
VLAKEIRDQVKSIGKLPLEKKIKDQVAAVLPVIDQYTESAKKVVELSLSAKLEEAKAALPSFEEKFKHLEKELERLGTLVNDSAQASTKHAGEAAELARLASYLVLIAGLLAGLGFGYYISRGLRTQLTSMITSLAAESNNVSATAATLSSTANELTESATSQAGALQETASSLEEITSMVNKTSENSKALEKSAQSSHESASRGQQTTTQMLAAIDDISDSNAKIMAQIETGNQKIAEIVKVISEIGNKTKVINDIVFQTKLLSFNASVEAARAGEHGKGFAVVAEEVGNLAQMSGNAAKEISEMLESSIRTVNTIVNENKEKVEKLISDGRTKLETGKEVSGKCKQALEEIVNQSTEVSRLISEITTAIQEQNQGIQEISKALNLLDQSAPKPPRCRKRPRRTPPASWKVRINCSKWFPCWKTWLWATSW